MKCSRSSSSSETSLLANCSSTKRSSSGRMDDRMVSMCASLSGCIAGHTARRMLLMEGMHPCAPSGAALRRHVEIAQRARVVVRVLGLDQGLVAPFAALAFQQMAANQGGRLSGCETQDTGLLGGDAHHRPQHVADQRVIDDLIARPLGFLSCGQLADQLIARQSNECPAHGMTPVRKGRSPPAGEGTPAGWWKAAGTRREVAMGSDPGEVPVLGQRSELVAQVAETVALLTQHAPIHGGIELDDIAQRPEHTEQCRVAVFVRLDRSLGRRSSRFAAERRGIDQRVARAARLLPAGRLGGGRRRRRGGLRFLVDRIDFLRTQPAGVVTAQGVDVGQGHPAQEGADLDDHATVGGVRGRANLRDGEIALVLAFGVLVEFGVLHDELADGGRKAPDVEVAVAAVDGLDGQLAGNGDHEELLRTKLRSRTRLSW
mmetsp:Transcript_20222/g.37412  ORF Transcript_20222/g.37412 Transcript_20222/m.37412 type:complete len:431 (-) Transcript_20222:152-1444(-)